MATITSLKVDVSNINPWWEWLDKGLALEMSAFKLFMVADLNYQLSW